MRARDLGIEIGLGSPGPLNAITDVAGVRVGAVTLVDRTSAARRHFHLSANAFCLLRAFSVAPKCRKA